MLHRRRAAAAARPGAGGGPARRGLRHRAGDQRHLAAPPGIDWICVSPKADAALAQTSGQELKLVYPQDGVDPAAFEHLAFERFSLQPMDGPDREAATRAAIAYCLAHPRWRLSLQTHKYLGIP